MRIIAICYVAILASLILWLVWEWRADVRYRKRYMPPHGRRRTYRLLPHD